MEQQQFKASINGWEEIWMEERAGTEKNATREAKKPTMISLVGLLFHFAKSKIANYWRWTIFLLDI
jgi:hypothetical protein